MKKLIIAALLVIGISSFAQENQSDKKPKKGQREQMSPEQRNQAALDKMTTELKLDANQQEQIKPILAEQSAKMEAMRAERANGNGQKMTKEDREAFMAKRQEEQKANEAKYKAILTPQQFKKMKDNAEAARQKMREARGDGNWGNRDNGNGGDRGNGGNGDGGNMGGEN